MIYISVQGWTSLLLVNRDEHDHVWFEESGLDPAQMPPIQAYGLEELLKDWTPRREHRSH